MSEFNYHDRLFRGVENYDSGDLNAETRFHYYQAVHTVWGTITGGGVRRGTLIADLLENGSLDMRWMYLNIDGEFVVGSCLSTPELLADGRYRLHELWQITGGESGSSVIEELFPPDH